MSKTLKRPMFRKGGSANQGMTGIMSGIVDRENHAEDPFVGGSDQYSFNTPFEGRTIPSLKDLTAESTEALLEAAGDRTGFDPLTSFLLSYGPALASAKPTGSTLGTLVGAAGEPLKQMIKEKSEEDKFQRGLRTRATASAIEKRDRMMETEAAREFEYEKSIQDKLFKKSETKADREFRTDLFNKETDRLLDIQANDFSNEEKILGLKQDFEGSLLEQERDLKLNMQKIDNALKSDLFNQEQKNKLELLKKEYENSKSLLEFKLKEDSSIDSVIKAEAQKLVNDDVIGSYPEAENTLTWKYKTSGNLMKQGYNVSDQILTEDVVSNTKKFENMAKQLYKKGGNRDRLFYFAKADKLYRLENNGKGKGVFKPFDPSKSKNIETGNPDEADNIVETVDGITNYEYGTGDTRDQKRDIRQTISSLKGPAFSKDSQYTDMTKDQKSAYEQYLSDYENR